LKSLLQELVRFRGEVILDTILGRRVRLVDVHSLSWAAQDGGPITDIGRCAADGVVEDEDADCASAAQCWSIYGLFVG
jgi:hypothetical protein